MLPLKNRLTKRTDFQKVYRSRSSASLPGLLLKWAPNGLALVRIGFSVEKKIFPKAVERNLAKRRLREAVRPLLKESASGTDAAIIVRNRKAVTDFSHLAADLRKLFVSARIIN